MVGRPQAEEDEMKCVHCQGRMERSHAPFHIDRDGVHLSLDAVPAWVCRQCGESYFEEREVESIQQIIRTVDAETKRLVATV